MAEEQIGWQEAVARLTGLRGHAERAATTLKRHGDDAARARAEHTYDGGRAEAEAVIAALTTALADGRAPTSLDELDARFATAVAVVEKLLHEAEAVLPAERGEKGVLEAVLASVVLAKLIEAVHAVYVRYKDDDALRRQTIATQLEGARWAAFHDLAAP